MMVRMFGGWDFPADMCDRAIWSSSATSAACRWAAICRPSRQGQARPASSSWRSRNPGTSEMPGSDLERVQIVKGWVDAAGDFARRGVRRCRRAERGERRSRYVRGHRQRCRELAGSGKILNMIPSSALGITRAWSSCRCAVGRRVIAIRSIPASSHCRPRATAFRRSSKSAPGPARFGISRGPRRSNPAVIGRDRGIGG